MCAPSHQESSLAHEKTQAGACLSLAEIIEKITTLPYDLSIPQERLDLAQKVRTSVLPWRGQFSPEFVEILLERYSRPGDRVCDPFVGSGTTLFEAARKNLQCSGVEINPSAVEMARTALFANVMLAERAALIREGEVLLERHVLPCGRETCLHPRTEHAGKSREFQTFQGEIFKEVLLKAQDHFLLQNFLRNVLIRYMSYPGPRMQGDVLRALREHTAIVEKLPYTRAVCTVHHCDARSIPVADSSVDLIITSPPYVNVLNYHQNNRSAMELLGWDVLHIAKSEIGSNRKNRQNRFLTVIQYVLDMFDALIEMRRLLCASGRAIVVVGRESHVRGVSFKNGVLVAALAVGGAGFQLAAIQERKFLNKFGETIYEDVLHLQPDGTHTLCGTERALAVAAWSLDHAQTEDDQVRSEIAEAKQRLRTVQKSPLFGGALLH